MTYNEKSLDTISQAVREQLGIEEPEDYIDETEHAIEYLNERIQHLESDIKKKDQYIHKLELLLIDESRRLDLLEKMYYEFKKELQK